MDQDEDQITVYSDYVCPFCYLGRQSLDIYRARRETELTIDWRPFDLQRHKRGPDGEIDRSIDDGKDDAFFERAQRNVDRLQESYDAGEMRDLDEHPVHVDSFDAQVASLYVKTEYPSRWLTFDEAIFTAFWVEGRNIGERDVLAAIADDTGLDGDDVRTAIEDETRRDRLDDQFIAAQQHGITGVPTFVYDQHAARGAVPPEQLEQLVDGA